MQSKRKIEVKSWSVVEADPSKRYIRRQDSESQEATMNASQLKAIAYHEAGHAVVAFFLAVPLRRATIVADAKTLGHVTSAAIPRATSDDIEYGDRFTPGRLRAEKNAMILMAGELAQRRFNPRSVRSYHANHDRLGIDHLLQRYGAYLPDRSIDYRPHYTMLRLWTEELLRREWPAVESVAKALIDRRTLSGIEIRAVILAAMGVKIPGTPDSKPE
jgi:hypothetical protein